MIDDPEAPHSPLSTPGPTISRHRPLPPWSIEAGSPGHLVLHLVVQGSFQLAHADGDVQAIVAGDIVGVDSSANDGASRPRLGCSAAPLGAQVIEPGEVLSASYPRGVGLDHAAGAWLSGLPPVMHLPASVVVREQGLLSIVSLLRAELASGSPGHERVVQALIDPLLAYTLRCWSATRTGQQALEASKPLDRSVAQALAAMQAEPARPWTVQALARAAGLSRAAFARRFLAALGVPPLRYLAGFRLQLAGRLLVEGDDSLARVAEQIGYDSEFAFSRAFKRHHGEAPGVFRRRVRACPALLRTPTRAAA